MKSHNEIMFKKCESLSKEMNGNNNSLKNWLHIKKAKDCLFSRRNGIIGKIVFGYSIRLRLFGRDII